MGIQKISRRLVNLDGGSPEIPVEDIKDDIVDQVIRAIRSVRYGQVQILIQDSRVVEIIEEIP